MTAAVVASDLHGTATTADGGERNDDVSSTSVVMLNDEESAAVALETTTTTPVALSVLAVVAADSSNSFDDDDSIPIAATEFVPCANNIVDRRPTILSVTVLKRTPKEDVGISIEQVEDSLRISRIDDDGIFSCTPIRVGDRVLSIDNSTCVHENLVHAMTLIKRSRQTVNLVVHRSDGDPFLMSTTVTKPEPTSIVGIGVQVRDGALCISSIEPSGLFAGSILSVGDKVVSICGVSCACMDAATAIQLIQQEKCTLTIVTWTKEEAGVVVAATKRGPLYTRYTSFVPCLFSILLLSVIALIVALTSRNSKHPVQGSDKTGEPCKNLYGQPIPYTHC